MRCKVSEFLRKKLSDYCKILKNTLILHIETSKYNKRCITFIHLACTTPLSMSKQMAARVIVRHHRTESQAVLFYKYRR